MNRKQQQLLFDKGITNVPSDSLCSDNALQEELGMAYYDGEHHVIQRPKLTMKGLPGKLLFVHALNGKKRYIVRVAGNVTDSIVWGTRVLQNQQWVFSQPSTICTTTGDVNVTAIGKTVIVSTAEGLFYAVWKDTTYNVYNNIPDPSVEFFLMRQTPASDDKRLSVRKNGSYYDTEPLRVAEDHQDEYDNATTGAYAEAKKLVAQDKGFCLPFFVRTALKMFDGSYTHISQPLLMYAATTDNSRMGLHRADTDSDGLDFFTLEMFYNYLYYKNSTDMQDLNDIVKSIDVFISRGIEIYDTTVHQKYQPVEPYLSMGISRTTVNGDDSVERYISVYAHPVLVRRPTTEIERDIKSVGEFYKIAELSLEGDGIAKNLGEKFETHTLENLTTQTQLPYDDFHSRSSLSGKYAYAYNSRLNMASMERGFFKGFESFIGYSSGQTAFYRALVTIDTGDGEKKVIHSYKTTEKQGYWFFYPDTRAKHVSIYKLDSGNYKRIIDEDLVEHERLNGAYFFGKIPAYNDTDPTPDSSNVAPTEGDDAYNSTHATPEHLYNQIATSVVNNPFVFNAEGYNTIGNGIIRAVSTQTHALSQGQFGAYPLIVFASDGIWAMAVDNTGLYKTIHPLSREVILENSTPLQVDGAVFFASEKGLMMIVGSEVSCVSQQLSGKAAGLNISKIGFAAFMHGAFMAYDYRDSLVWIFNSSTNYNEYCYVYSMRSATFTKFVFETPVNNVCIDYPDSLLQDTNGHLLSLTERENINSDEDTDYEGKIITRPMKLENALALKSILQIRHILRFSPYTVSTTEEDPETHEDVTVETTERGSIKLRIYASNNLDTWVELPSLAGKPWLYYQLKFVFENMIPTDTFAGSVLITQERRTNKLR